MESTPFRWWFAIPLTQLLAAADESPAGRHAIRTAHNIAAAARAQLMILRVLPVNSSGSLPSGRVASTRTGGLESPELQRFQHWLCPEPGNGPGRDAEIAVAFGVPAIEIARMAESRRAELIVLGRRPRSVVHRLLLGETADALVRRSDRPILFVPPQAHRLSRVVVAMDGLDRTWKLLSWGRWLAQLVGGTARVVTVEPVPPDEQHAAGTTPPRGRSLRLQELLDRYAEPSVPASLALAVRRGNPVDELLAEVEETHADALVIGYRRGGPPKVVGPTDIARNLLYAAPCAVLTVPV